MNIESVIKITIEDYIFFKAMIDGQSINVPLDPANRHYAEILRQVEAGELTIQESN